MSLTLVQAPTGPESDLWIWSMGDLQPELRRAAPGDAIVYYFNGPGTSRYEHPPTIEDVVARFPPVGGEPYRFVTLAAWSAGGRAVQRQLDAGFIYRGRIPDAVLLADALYAPLVNGKVDMAPLASVVEFAVRAATEPGRIFVMWHSAIQTPGYASSSQCAAAVRAAVEARVGLRLEAVFAPPLDGRAVARALRLGNFLQLAYGGASAHEHIAEAHMIDEAMQAFVPWASPDYAVVPGEFACFPDVAPASTEVSVIDDRFARALVEAARTDVGVSEQGGKGRGPRIEAYLRTVGEAPGADWRSAALATWLVEAGAVTGLSAPVKGGAAANVLIPQFQALGRWIPRSELAGRVAIGMVLVWYRNDGKGHVGVVEWVGTDGIHTLEPGVGPNGTAVARDVHQVDDWLLLGGGRV